MFSVLSKNGFANTRLVTTKKPIFAAKRRRMMWPGYMLVSVLSLLLLANVEQSIRLAEQEMLSFRTTALNLISTESSVKELQLPKQKQVAE